MIGFPDFSANVRSGYAVDSGDQALHIPLVKRELVLHVVDASDFHAECHSGHHAAG